MVRNQPNCILNTYLFPDAAFLHTDKYPQRTLKHITKMAIMITVLDCKAEIQRTSTHQKIPPGL